MASSNPGRRAAECNPGTWVSGLRTCASVTKQYNLVAPGEITAGLAESNDSLPPGLWLRLPAGRLPRTGISSGTLRSFRVWDYLYVIKHYIGLYFLFYHLVYFLCFIKVSFTFNVQSTVTLQAVYSVRRPFIKEAACSLAGSGSVWGWFCRGQRLCQLTSVVDNQISQPASELRFAAERWQHLAHMTYKQKVFSSTNYTLNYRTVTELLFVNI